MKNIAYYNGRVAPLDEMMVPMNDRACYFGDGVYDATCAVNHVPMAFDDHIDRIYRSAKLIDIDIPMEKDEMKRMLMSLIEQVEGDCLFVYWQVTRGVGMRSHAYSGAQSKPSIWAFVRPCSMRDPYGAYRCITMDDTRFLHCNIKTINLLPAVIANQRAEEAGCDETIFHRGDRVTECSHSNVHIIKDGVLRTAPCDNLILPGITRAHILNICAKAGIPVVEEPFTLEEMMAADEVFFSSSSALTCRVREIDGKPVGMKDEATFARIRDAYQQELRAECGLA
ncbi:MAG: D-amino acid aminotransferase [Clostridia bacterium]|nr:D-amino acid aminotransferase [Clostridia bacterium]